MMVMKSSGCVDCIGISMSWIIWRLCLHILFLASLIIWYYDSQELEIATKHYESQLSKVKEILKGRSKEA